MTRVPVHRFRRILRRDTQSPNMMFPSDERELPLLIIRTGDPV